jgi:hypothetical protein
VIAPPPGAVPLEDVAASRKTAAVNDEMAGHDVSRRIDSCIAKPESAQARLPRRLVLSSNRYAAGDPSFIKEAETADTIVGR